MSKLYWSCKECGCFGIYEEDVIIASCKHCSSRHVKAMTPEEIDAEMENGERAEPDDGEAAAALGLCYPTD